MFVILNKRSAVKNLNNITYKFSKEVSKKIVEKFHLGIDILYIG